MVGFVRDQENQRLTEQQPAVNRLHFDEKQFSDGR